MRAAVKTLVLCAAAMWGTAGAVGAAEIILYDYFDFQGPSVTLNQSAPDLRDYNFDNDLESFKVISGTWRIHRDANYQDNSGPSLTVGPGDYPNIEDLGYPQDRMSSVRLIVDPVAASCPAPYQTPNADGVTCTFTCAQGTVPDQASGQCVCQQGYVQTGADNQGRRICGPQQAPPPPTTQPGTQPLRPAAPTIPTIPWVRLGGFDLERGAYQTFDRSVRLGSNVSTSANLQGARQEYRAAEGPPVTNDAAMLQILANAPWRTWQLPGYTDPAGTIRFQLSAQAGAKYVYFQVRARFAPASGPVRWIVSEPHGDTILLTPQGDSSGTVVYNVSAEEAYDEARARGFRFTAIADVEANDNTACEFSVRSGAMILTAKEKSFRIPRTIRGKCVFRFFEGRQLAPGWSIESPQVTRDPCARGRSTVVSIDGVGLGIAITNIDFGYRPNPLKTCLLRQWRVSTIPIRGPVGFNWQAAFQ